ncbi:hypothetical protein O9G_002528 [Rozella allomycis CSF55]|uniref:Peroxin/Ferlin domain-containing protein n=1 Tax=Rozella allomycis (strain CSF55) TaxID=988480 RepID=A0A075AU39_ROZAC|nr:hypothetical protein O9G_002528 [Rozella allomycis CSF55]|eukprot:EPZ33816.1 hypothetical protein O9G_002528 [Rozella allomycis CSF55]
MSVTIRIQNETLKYHFLSYVTSGTEAFSKDGSINEQNRYFRELENVVPPMRDVSVLQIQIEDFENEFQYFITIHVHLVKNEEYELSLPPSNYLEKRKWILMMQNSGYWTRLRFCLSGKDRISFNVSAEPYGSLRPETSWKAFSSNQVYNAIWNSSFGSFSIAYKSLRQKILNLEDKIVFRYNQIADEGSTLEEKKFLVVYEEVYENQRGNCFFGTPRFSSKSLLPTDFKTWTTADGGYHSSPKQTILPSPEWKWSGDWFVDNKFAMQGLEKDGWMYAFNWNTKFTTNFFTTSYVRRRRWLRKRIRPTHLEDARSLYTTSSTSQETFGILDQIRNAKIDRERLDIIRNFIQSSEQLNKNTLRKKVIQLLQILSYFDFDRAKFQACQVQAKSNLVYYFHREQLYNK